MNYYRQVNSALRPGSKYVIA